MKNCTILRRAKWRRSFRSSSWPSGSGFIPSRFFRFSNSPSINIVAVVHHDDMQPAGAVNAGVNPDMPQPEMLAPPAAAVAAPIPCSGCDDISEREELVGALGFSVTDYLLALPIVLLALFAVWNSAHRLHAPA